MHFQFPFVFKFAVGLISKLDKLFGKGKVCFDFKLILNNIANKSSDDEYIV